MNKYTIRVVLEDGRILETPPIELLSEEQDTYDVAEDIAERYSDNRSRFFHIDGGPGYQKLVTMDRIVSVDVLACEMEGEIANMSERANRVRLSLVETPPA